MAVSAGCCPLPFLPPSHTTAEMKRPLSVSRLKNYYAKFVSLIDRQRYFLPLFFFFFFWRDFSFSDTPTWKWNHTQVLIWIFIASVRINRVRFVFFFFSLPADELLAIIELFLSRDFWDNGNFVLYSNIATMFTLWTSAVTKYWYFIYIEGIMKCRYFYWRWISNC